MNYSVQGHESAVNPVRLAGLLFLLACLAALAGCGSTKVYTADKSVVYRGQIYNLSSVKQVNSSIEFELPGGQVVDGAGYDKRAFNDLLKQHKEVTVTSKINLDGTGFVYEKRVADSYSDYSKVVKNQQGAMNKITKFMADGKKTQLKLG